MSNHLASWKGLSLVVTRLTEQVGHDWVQHTYPGRDGVELESMGGRADRLELELQFFGDTWWEDLLVFLAAVRQPGPPDTFVHPIWGSVEGVMTDVRVVHEDRRHSSARVEAVFVAGTAATFAFSASTTLDGAAAGVTAAASDLSSATAALAAS